MRYLITTLLLSLVAVNTNAEYTKADLEGRWHILLGTSACKVLLEIDPASEVVELKNGRCSDRFGTAGKVESAEFEITGKCKVKLSRPFIANGLTGFHALFFDEGRLNLEKSSITAIANGLDVNLSPFYESLAMVKY